jgi:magnesium-transporting ATPase (P-type)
MSGSPTPVSPPPAGVGSPVAAETSVAATTGPEGLATTGPEGLATTEARRRLDADGPNRLPDPAPHPWWRALLAQVVHFFALMLWAAAALAWIGGLPVLAGAIAAVVVINGGFSFVQEFRAERMATQLRALLPRRATVRRDGMVHEIDAVDLVVGDLVLLAAGDRISADARVVEAHGLSVDRSTLTGESVPVAVAVDGTVAAGTFVVGGEATTVVTATGGATRLASIATLTRAQVRPPSPLAREIRHLVQTIAVIAIGVGVSFFGLSLLLGTPASDGFLFAIGVTVALVPEGMLPTVTLSLAIGAQRMATHHALVRRLESVETLGSTTVICTDKTGTLTRNEMTVVEVWTPAGAVTLAGPGYGPDAEITGTDTARAAAARAVAIGVCASSGHARLDHGTWIVVGDPMEAALDAARRRLGAAELHAPVRARHPFDARRLLMSVVAGGTVHVKGAPEAVFARCRAVPPDAPARLAEMTTAGRRVLAVACAPDPGGDADAVEHDLELVGLVALEDPPRTEVADALTACRRAGVAVVMVTGDHPATALAVAVETGLHQPGAPCVEGPDLPADDDALGALLDHDGAVVSRVSPEQKLRIAVALQTRGHVVAMTGDGVNDGPALQQADIGVAMGRSGTDVAREAADLVLLDDDFATIVTAIAQGRSTYTNVRRFLTYHLTDNVAELTPFVVWALSGGQIPLALGVLQILCLDLGTDLLPAVALGAEPPSPDVLDHPPQARRLLDRRVLVRAFGVLGPAEAVVEMAAFLAVFVAAGWRPGDPFPGGATLLAASGAAFTAVVLGQLTNALACRSVRRPVWAQPRPAGVLLPVALGVEALALVGFLFVPAVAALLGQAPPTVTGWLVAATAVPAVLLVDAAHKARRRRAAQTRAAQTGAA